MYKLPSPNARSCGIESKKNIARLSLASTSLQRFCCFLSHSSCRPGENLQRRNVRPEIGTRSYCISFKLVKKIFEKKTHVSKKKKFETTFEIFLKYRNHRISSSNESEALASHPEKPMEINGPQREKNPGESACHEISVTFCHYIPLSTHPLRKEYL